MPKKKKKKKYVALFAREQPAASVARGLLTICVWQGCVLFNTYQVVLNTYDLIRTGHIGRRAADMSTAANFSMRFDEGEGRKQEMLNHSRDKNEVTFRKGEEGGGRRARYDTGCELLLGAGREGERSARIINGMNKGKKERHTNRIAINIIGMLKRCIGLRTDQIGLLTR